MKKWSLNAKIVFILSVFIMACLVISTIGLMNMNSINANLASVVNLAVRRVIYLKDLQGLLRNNIISEKNYALEKDLARMTQIREDMESNNKVFVELLESFRTIASEYGRSKVPIIQSGFQEWWELSKQVQGLAYSRKQADAIALSNGKTRQVRMTLEGVIKEVVEFNTKFMEAEVNRANDAYSRAKNLMILISFISIFSGLSLAYLVLSATHKAINQVISTLDESSTQVTSAAQQIAATSEQLSQSTAEQASSLQETVSSVEQMNSMVQKNADNASQSSNLSSSSYASAEKGKKVVEDMIQAIDGISSSNNDIMNQINESNEKISEIVKVIAEIGNKTKVINDIVFQTKLLSFNASVEAARAGDHGKGFAVVAEEVGSLAQMSGNAAKEITAMLEESIQKVEGIVLETKTKVGHLVTDGRGKVETGIHIAQQCGEVLLEIVNNISTVKQMVSEISLASQEQAQGIQEISKAMSQLDQVTQQNSSASEESASAAVELSSQAESLRNVIQLLVEVIRGGQQKQGISEKQFSLKKSLSFKELGVPSKSDPRFSEV